MTIQQIENLLAAGFNHDEIMQLARDEPNAAPADPEPAAAPEPVNPVAPDPEPGPAAKTQETEPAAKTQETEPAAAPEMTETNNRLDALEKSIAALVKSIQTQNVKNDSYGGMPDSLEQQTDKIMMSIIRPEIERKAN